MIRFQRGWIVRWGTFHDSKECIKSCPGNHHRLPGCHQPRGVDAQSRRNHCRRRAAPVPSPIGGTRFSEPQATPPGFCPTSPIHPTPTRLAIVTMVAVASIAGEAQSGSRQTACRSWRVACHGGCTSDPNARAKTTRNARTARGRRAQNVID